MAPRRSKTAPRWLQDGSKTTQDRPKTSQDASRLSQDVQRSPQRRSKTAPRRPKTAPRRLKTARRHSIIRSKTLQDPSQDTAKATPPQDHSKTISRSDLGLDLVLNIKPVTSSCSKKNSYGHSLILELFNASLSTQGLFFFYM